MTYPPPPTPCPKATLEIVIPDPAETARRDAEIRGSIMARRGRAARESLRDMMVCARVWPTTKPGTRQQLEATARLVKELLRALD